MHLLYSIALLFVGLFAGTCLYVALVAQPARARLEDAVALQSFKASLASSRRLQPLLAALGVLATLGVCVLEPTPLRLAALLVQAPVIPATLLLVTPVYKALEAPALELEPSKAVPLLDKFGRLHAIRTGVVLLGYGLLLAGVW